MQYDICSVNWNQKQTDLWLHYVKKNCPDATVTLIPDEKPIPWCWSGGKINCFKQKFKTDKIIYLDTDTIVTKDLYHVFEDMGDCMIGLSDKITPRPMHKGNRRCMDGIARLDGKISYHFSPEHFSSGMMIVRGEYVMDLYQNWLAMMLYPPFVEQFKKFRLAEEVSLMLVMARDFRRDQIYNIPLEVHGNLLGGVRIFGSASMPEVMHYHQEKRARGLGLGEYFGVA